MFEDWIDVLSSFDVATAETVTLRKMLGGLSRLRGAIDACEAGIAAQLGEASLVRGATRCTQREADRAIARGKLLAAAPAVAEALAAGAITGAHVDTLSRAAERSSAAAVAGSGLLAVAEGRPADAMRAQVDDFVRTTAADADLAERHTRQRRNRSGHAFAGDEMGILHAEFDDTVFGEIRSAIDTETDRLYHLDGGRECAAEVRTAAQRRADAIANLLTRTDPERGGPPAVRNQMLVVSHTDGAGHIPGVGALPRAEVARLMCISDLYGVVFDTAGQPLWHGTRIRLADDNQWRALIARDGGCIGCGAHPSRCEAHHVIWRRNHGSTDIDNLVLACKHHHHLIHDKGWRIIDGPDGTPMLVPP
ncbi:MAG: HNH endonuclease [Acidimicrobiales bacterium]